MVLGGLAVLLWVPAAGAVVFAPTPASPYGVSIPAPMAGGHPAAVAAADFNGDGHRDLVVVTQQACADFVSVLLGTGDGGFSPAAGSPFALGEYECGSFNEPDTVAVADFNGDGHPDLAVTTLDALHVLLGDGSGGFTSASKWLPPGGLPAWPNPNYPSSVAAADFNGDGEVDLAVGTEQGVGILLGDGAGNFTEAHFYGGGSGAGRGVTVADFNGDGMPDLAVTDYTDGDVSVLLGDGSGGFAPASGSPFPVSGDPVAVTAADFNADGHLDLAVALALSSTSSGGVSVLLGDGSGGFSAASDSPFAASWNSSGIEAADVNKDGHPDLVVPGGSPPPSFIQGVSVLLGDGSGGFTPLSGWPQLSDDGAMWPDSVAVADFNGDDAPDIATSFSSGINSGGLFVFLSVPPDTSISDGPATTTSSTSATFSFSSTDSSARYQCKLDSADWTPCTAPITYSDLDAGAHAFDVRATNDVGLTDPSPAVQTWAVDGLSVDDGDYATNTPDVTLNLGWPAHASKALISNDARFGSAGGTKTVPLAAKVPWKLAKGSEHGPITVYVRFPDSAHPTRTYTDEIILDTTSPLIQSATLAVAARTTARLLQPQIYNVRLQATEKRSGISLVQFSRHPRGGTNVVLTNPKRRGIVRLSRLIRVTMPSPPKWVRIRSAAGNWSNWHHIH